MAQVTYEAFKAGLEAAGIAVDDAKMRQLAADSGNVDLETIPNTATAEIQEYTPKRGKNPVPNLYAVVSAFVQGKWGQAHFGRLSSLRQDVEKMEAALPALKALVEDLDGEAENTTIPEGWTIDGDDSRGYHSTRDGDGGDAEIAQLRQLQALLKKQNRG